MSMNNPPWSHHHVPIHFGTIERPPKSTERGLWVKSNIQNVRTLGDDDKETSMELIQMDIPGIRMTLSKGRMARTSASSRLYGEIANEKQSPFPELPTEIIEQILEYLIPINASYHAFAQPRSKDTTIVHIVSQEQENPNPAVSRHYPSRPNLTALATVNWRLNKLYMSTFYGNNCFILELASQPYWPMPMRRFKQKRFPEQIYGVHSWARLYNVPFDGCWPLNERSMPYVRDLTLVVTIPDMSRFEGSQDNLRRQVRQVVSLLRHSQRLAILTIDVRPDGILDADRRLGWNVPGRGSYHALELREIKHCCPLGCPLCDHISWLWEMFRGVRCAVSVVLSGYISVKAAQQLAETMQR